MKQRALFEHLIWTLKADIGFSSLPSPRFCMLHCPQEIWEQKLFCILSSQVRADRAAKAASQIVGTIPFFEKRLPLQTIENACFNFLTSPEVRYRFPQSRARQISQCWFSFAQIMDDYQAYVCSFRNEIEARSSLVETFPGLGLKQSSMFLRNIGASKDLCVIDVHLLFYLEIFHSWENKNLTRRRYLQAEEHIKKDAEHYGLELNVFDTLVWGAARAIKKARLNV